MMHRWAKWIAAAGVVAGAVGCANVGIGLSLPIGRIGGVGVSVGGDGQVGVGVGVGAGHGGVQVGAGGTLPRPAEPAAPASAAASSPLS